MKKHAKKNHGKRKIKKTKSSDPWARSGERPGWGHGSELFFFLFFVFPWFFAVWPKPRENQKKKNKKTKSSDPWARSGERPGWGHGSELFVFFVFFSIVFCSLANTQPGLLPMGLLFFLGFLEVLAKLQKTMEKQKKQKQQKVQSELFFPLFFAGWPKPRENQKKQKVQTHGQGLGRGLAGGHGSEFFSIACCLHVFHVKMLSSQYLSKNAKFYNLHTCAPHEYPFWRAGSHGGRGCESPDFVILVIKFIII